MILLGDIYFGHISCYFGLSHIVLALVNFKPEVFHLQDGDTNNNKDSNSDNNPQLGHRVHVMGFSGCRHYISLQYTLYKTILAREILQYKYKI